MEGDEERAGAGQAGDPAGEAVVGVDEVEALGTQQRAQAAGRGEVMGAAAGKAEFLDLDPAGANLGDLVADPATALRRGLVGDEVGDDEDAHRGRLSAPVASSSA